MTLERIAAIGQATPVRRIADAGQRPPAGNVGSAIGYGPVAAAQGPREARAVEALALQADLNEATGALLAGDVLLVKVIGVKPQLEFAVLDAVTRQRGGTSENEQPAMRADQLAWQRQRVSIPPEAVSLAASWRTTMLEQLEDQDAQRERAEVWPASARSAFAAGDGVAASQSRAASLYPLPNPNAQPWVLTAYAWGGLRVLLRLLAVERDAPPPAKGRSRTLAIRLALVLADIGGVVVQLQLATDGVLLDFAVERAASQQALRDRLPLVISAVARADLCVARCRVASGLLGDATPGAPGAASTAAAALALTQLLQSHPSAASALSMDLFRAAAEVVLALSSA